MHPTPPFHPDEHRAKSPRPTPAATPAPAASLAPTPMPHILADRRARRAAILARHSSGTPNAGFTNGTLAPPLVAPAVSKPPSPAVGQEQAGQFTPKRGRARSRARSRSRPDDKGHDDENEFDDMAKLLAAPTISQQIVHSDTASDPDYSGDAEGARDQEVAIRIVRSQEVVRRAGLEETAILSELQAADPEDQQHLVRLERTLEHRGHLCVVFGSLRMNLRNAVKRFRKGVGLNIRAVYASAHQLFIALRHLRKLGVTQ
ncbi:Serine/threonine protein kinase PRP4 [Mycena kentingensis (nom. inval.)]|nr:Serine/threonine protein kinase PRP4 [Mycena kentingensis (nom. inval.)]